MELIRSITKSPSLNHIFLTILPLAIISISHIHTTSAAKTPQAYTNFIKKSCSATTYPPLCIKTLSPYATAVKSNPLKLCSAALTVAIQSTRNCSTAVTKIAGNRRDITGPQARAVKDCIGDLKDAVYQLKQTVDAMAHLREGDREFRWASAKTYASAAITDAETCVDGFLGRKVNAAVKKKIEGCVSGVEKLISNALSLINHLY